MATAWFTHDPEIMRLRGLPLLLSGVIIVGFGASILVWPRLTAEVLLTILGVAMLAFGMVFLYAGWLMRRVEGHPWLVELWPGVVLIVLGAISVASPSLVSTVAIVVLGAGAILVGIGDAVSAASLASTVKWWWLRALRGALLVVIGAWIVLTPISGLAALGWIVGLWAIAIGIVCITLGFLVLRA